MHASESLPQSTTTYKSLDLVAAGLASDLYHLGAVGEVPARLLRRCAIPKSKPKMNILRTRGGGGR